MLFRRLIGNALIALGAVQLLNFYSPRPIPTFGLSAFIFGGLFIGAGLFIRAGRTGAGNAPASRRLFAGGNATDKRKAAADPLLAVRVLRLAADKRGSLTVSIAAMELDVPLDAAEAALDECAAKGSAYIDVDPASGIASYRFPEFLPPPPRSG